MARKVFQMRDKHLSTTNLYPKQIEQSLPKDVVPVATEPETYTPTGEEPEAEYITINNVTYKVGGGTLVIANPTLAGTEADLTGIQIGDVKYKVSSGSKKYIHHIRLTKSGDDNFNFDVISNDITAFTFSTLLQHFSSKETQGLFSNYRLMATGRHLENSTGYPIVAVIYDSDNDAIGGIYISSDGSYLISRFYSTDASQMSCIDYVEEI